MLALLMDVAPAIGSFGIIGLAAAGGAYWIFRTWAKGWLRSQFEEDLAEFKASKDKELKRLRAEINRLAGRATKFHEKEYEIPPEAWGLPNKAYGGAAAAVSGCQQPSDLAKMRDVEFDEYLGGSDLPESEKHELRTATDRNRVHSPLGEAGRPHAQFQNYVILNGVFIETPIADKMTEAAKYSQQAITCQNLAEQRSHEMYKMSGVDFAKVMVRLEPPELARIDRWASEQPDKPSRPEAIRRLISEAFKR